MLISAARVVLLGTRTTTAGPCSRRAVRLHPKNNPAMGTYRNRAIGDWRGTKRRLLVKGTLA